MRRVLYVLLALPFLMSGAPAYASDRPVAHLVGEINDELAEKFASEMDRAETLARASRQPVVIEIDSPGGSDSSGQTISKRIERSSAVTICVVDGEAASMAFYVLQSCDVRVMRKRSMLMTHHAHVSGMLNAAGVDDLESLAAYLRATDRAYAEWCIHRTTITYEEWCEKTAGKMWWLNWPEALERHAVDQVIE